LIPAGDRRSKGCYLCAAAKGLAPGPPPAAPAAEAAASPEAPPSKAFAAEFLGRLEERDDEPPAAVEADYAGPWRMARLPDGRIGLFRLRQRPFAWFRERHDALLTAAVLAARRDPGYRIRAEEDGERYAVESRAEWGETVGWVEQFDPDLAAGLSWADAFMRSPCFWKRAARGCWNGPERSWIRA
jgi:hypothetical protein